VSSEVRSVLRRVGVGAQLLKLGGVRPGHLGQAPGGVVEPGEDLVPFPFGVFPYPRDLAAGVADPGLPVEPRQRRLFRRAALLGPVAAIPDQQLVDAA
jgi:hypothetical protein